MATKKRTTKPVSSEFRALHAAFREARATGEDPARAAYKVMSPKAKVAFIRARAS
jgi:hypothetical protein